MAEGIVGQGGMPEEGGARKRCMTCREEAAPGRRSCQACLDAGTQYGKARRERWKAEGLCPYCGGEKDAVWKMCGPCREQRRVYTQRKLEKKRQKPPEVGLDGQTVKRCQCSVILTSEASRCDRCAARRRELAKNRNEAGGCRNCAHGKAEEGFSQCLDCLIQQRKHVRACRERKRQGGICLSCAEPAAKGHMQCQKHLEDDRIRWMARPREDRMCHRCGMEVMKPLQKLCEPCRCQNLRDISNKWRALAIARGVCLRCCGKAQDGMQHCRTCRLRQKQLRDVLKKQVMDAYGGLCAICGENDLDHLTIDHINNDGSIWRKDNPTAAGGTAFYRKVVEMGYPRDLQCLCWNCNLKKRVRPDLCEPLGDIEAWAGFGI